MGKLYNDYDMIANPDPLPKEVVEAITKWEKREKSRLFGLITTGQPLSLREIDRGLVFRIRNECKKCAPIKRLDVLLESGGGDPDAAYLIITCLKAKCDELRIFIPNWAKSAATLLCLGADEIWMSDTAELGPLDAQIQDPRAPQEGRVSALEQFRAMDYLKRYSFQMLDTYVNLLLDRVPTMRLKEMLDEATPFVTQLMASLYGQVDPMHFGASYRALDIAIEYGRRIMARHQGDKTSEDVIRILNELTWQYPSHSFVIDHIEAKELGFNVKKLTGELEEFADIISEKMYAWFGFMEVAV
jgi:hypothetical protein